MAETTKSNGHHGVVALNVKDADHNSESDEHDFESGCFVTLPFAQKVTHDFCYYFIHTFVIFMNVLLVVLVTNIPIHIY